MLRVIYHGMRSLSGLLSTAQPAAPAALLITPSLDFLLCSPMCRELTELGPQLQALAPAMSAELAQVSGCKRAVLLQQQHGALLLLSALWPSASVPDQDILQLRIAFNSLAHGTSAVLAASAAALAAPRQPDEEPQQLRAILHMSALEHLQQLGRIASLCDDMDTFVFNQPRASKALAQHALNDSTGHRWVAAAVAAIASGAEGGSGAGSPPLDLRTAHVLASLLT